MTDSLPTLTKANSWQELLQPLGRAALEAALPAYIQLRRWFGGKARGIASAQLLDTIPITYDDQQAMIAMVRVSYGEGLPDTYVLPLACATGAHADQLARDFPHALIAHIQRADGERGVLHDALLDRGFCAALLELIASGGRQAGATGAIQASPTGAFARLRGLDPAPLEPKIVTVEQSNSSIIYGDRLIMKLFRRLEPGLNLDLEIGRFLTERGFRNSPPAAGAIEYHAADSGVTGLAFLQGFVPNQGDAWSYTLRTIAQSFVGVRHATPRQTSASPLALAGHEIPPQARALLGVYLASAELLGRRTAELHLVLASDSSDAAFVPEPFDEPYRQVVFDSMCSAAGRALQALRRALAGLPEPLRQSGQRILALEGQIIERFRSALDQPIEALRTRVHGDYHLGQVLVSDDDFYIIDFEGEPARSLTERRNKNSPLQDVAGMLRSFHYAPYAVLFGQAPGVAFDDEDVRALEPWARLWHHWTSAAFLKSYLATADGAPFLPRSPESMRAMLDIYLLDKAIYELAYELNNRPAWVQIPVEGILQLVEIGE
jgi:maltose alpha-D-glucosyltransferase / alpha-amylase